MTNQLLENSKISTVAATRYSRKMDDFFEDIYKKNIESYLSNFKDLLGFELIESTIKNTPQRKFKSAIPFIAGGKDARVVPYACIAEIVFAMWTIVDNFLDKRNKKYEKSTTYETYDHGFHIAPIYGWITDLERLVTKIVNIDFAKGLTQYIAKQAKAQYLLSKFNYKMLEEDYYEIVRDRSLFLGYIWAKALEEIGMASEAEYIQTYQWHSALFGQILNDYFDSIKTIPDEAGMLRTSLSWILLYQAKKNSLQDYVTACCNAENKKEQIKIYQDIIKKYCISKQIRKKAKKKGKLLYDFLDLHKPENYIRCLLRAWQLMSEKDVQIISPKEEIEAIDFFETEINIFENLLK